MSVQASPLAAVVKQIQAGQRAQAKAALQRFLQRQPDNADANHLMGMVLTQLGEYKAAEYYLQRAIKTGPSIAAYHNSLANLYVRTDRAGEAVETLRRAVTLDPRMAVAWAGLSGACFLERRYADAADAAFRCIELAPNAAMGYVNVSGALAEMGEIERCLSILREAGARFPRDMKVRASILPQLHYSPAVSDREIMETHAAYGALLAAAAPPPPARSGDADPERPLHIAYMSPDFREHSVSYFAEPLLEHRDRGSFRVTCYAISPRKDAVTQRFMALADQWVEAAGMNDEALAHRIRSDRVDILVELAGHTVGNRLAVLARRAAPVQATYIGYPSTTGVPNVDYRLVDSLTDPPGAEAFATERLVRLDPCFLCYRPPGGAPEVSPPPCLENGSITFGSFNILRKHSPPVIDLWARLLREVPGSRLVLKNRSFADERVRASAKAHFVDRGIEPDRIEILEPAPSTAGHLQLYSRVDIGLDPFPYNGTTTTCEALWMGVPVVCLAGDRHSGRVGQSLLNAVGLSELICADEEAYFRAARDLASDPDRLRTLRSGMRERLSASPLLDGPGYVRRVERAYRAMWREWCGTA